jgi:glycosyltransferase involved in cell wall biosynthesis
MNKMIRQAETPVSGSVFNDCPKELSEPMVWLSAYPWDDPYKQRLHHMLPYFSRDRVVVWIDTLMPARQKVKTLLRNPFRMFRDLSFRAAPNLHVVRIYPTFPCTLANRFPWLYRVNGAILRRKIVKHLRRIGIRGFIAGTPHPYMYNHVIDSIGARKTFYDCPDDFDAFPWSTPNSNTLESALLRKVNVRFASSGSLVRSRESLGGKAVNLVPNGVDFEIYRNYDYQSNRIEWPTKPAIGYVGALAEWFDFGLLESLLTRFPGYLFVLVGSAVPGTRDTLESLLKRFANLRWEGQQPYSRIPALISSFDVGIIPFVRSPLIDGVSPIKLFEYAACGLPVVSTYWRELEDYREFAYLGSDGEAFASHLESSVEKGKSERQKEFAKANSWQQRVESMLAILSR